MFQVDVLEHRLRVALQNSKHSFDSECPLYTPDNAQNLLLGYAEEAHKENSLPGNVFTVHKPVSVLMLSKNVRVAAEVEMH